LRNRGVHSSAPAIRSNEERRDGRQHDSKSEHAFVFERDRHSEIEAGYALAGILVIDFPKPKRRGDVPGRAKRLANPIIQFLAKMAGHLPSDATVFGWKNGIKPPNADDITENGAVMEAWAEKRVWIAVRVSKDGRFPADSYMKRELGFVSEH
jgi:hypothetical protein